MEVSYRYDRYWVPKKGSSEEEYEDAFAPAECLSSDKGLIRVAIADGATESSYARPWAQVLVSAVVAPCASGIIEILPEARKRWLGQVMREDLPWYASEKIATGAFAALLTLTLEPNSDSSCGKWCCEAIGDTCLVLVRENRAIERFPMEHSSDFGQSPFLLPSSQGSKEEVSCKVLYRKGEYYIDDRFYLMTDAIACWFLAEDEAGRSPWSGLDAVQSRDDFQTMISSLRKAGSIKNDDTTILRISIHQDPRVR